MTTGMASIVPTRGFGGVRGTPRVPYRWGAAWTRRARRPATAGLPPALRWEKRWGECPAVGRSVVYEGDDFLFPSAAGFASGVEIPGGQQWTQN